MHNSRILLQQAQCLVLQPALVKIIGKSPALVLQQIHYWISSNQDIGKVESGARYIRNTLEQWVNEIQTLSLSTIKRSIAVLKKNGLITIKKFNSKWGNQTNWYTINYERIREIVGEEANKQKQKEASLSKSQTYEAKMSQSTAQNEPINIETKITNKEVLKNPIKSELSKNIKNQTGKNYDQNPLPQRMLSIWTEEINPEIKPTLNQTRARLLVAAFKLKFNNDLRQWKTYCKQIATSDYLMGKINPRFKVTLEWILKFDTIQRIKELQFGVKAVANIESLEEAVTESLSSYPEKEKGFRRLLIDKLGAGTYKSWFEEAKINLTSTMLEITTKSRFHRDWIYNNFSFDLEKIFLKEVVIK